MNGKVQNSAPTWIDPDDAPEITDDWITEADLYAGDRLVRRGRPRLAAPKRAVTVRYDADIIAAFKATGPGWQTRMNAALREWLERHPAA